MKAKKRVGIWMDHSTARLIDYDHDKTKSHVVRSAFTRQQRQETLEKNEHVMHQKEQHEQIAFYKKIATLIKPYDEVLIFGPTTAKNELFNTLKSDHHFDHVKIELQQAKKMTENEQHIFVLEHFSKQHEAVH